MLEPNYEHTGVTSLALVELLTLVKKKMSVDFSACSI